MEKIGMKKRISLLVIGAMFLLASCVDKTEIPPTGLPTKMTATIRPTLTRTPTPAEIPSSTPPPTTALPSTTPSDTPTPTPDSGVIQNCLTIQPTLPEGPGYTGMIAFEDAFPGYSGIALYDVQVNKVTRIASDGTYLAVSPDRSLFAIKDISENQLKIFSPDGKRIKAFPWKENWRWIERWLDNQNILIAMLEIKELTGDLVSPPKVLLFNPFTGLSQTLIPDFPEIDTGISSSDWPWLRFSETIYSPDLKRVVYPGIIDLYPGRLDAGMGYILYGIPEKKKLAQIPNLYWQNPPAWSPDGSMFIMVGNGEFYLVGYDGAISKITHLNPDLDLEKGTGFRYLADYYSWSPDSQHVAFWLSPFGTDRYTLAVLDTHSGEITDYCIPAGGDGLYSWGYTTLYPVWSPDGKKLVVAANFRPKWEHGNDVILVDLEKKTSFKVTSDNFPYGWLVSP
jgi:hypothetical protein